MASERTTAHDGDTPGTSCPHLVVPLGAQPSDGSTRRPGSMSGPGLLIAVRLRQRPSLHRLRRGQALFVRWLRRYYDAVRLIIHVPVHRSVYALMNRPGPVRAWMTSPRFRSKDVCTCHGAYDGARSIPHLPVTHEMMLPSLQRKEIGTSNLDPFRRSMANPWSPM